MFFIIITGFNNKGLSIYYIRHIFSYSATIFPNMLAKIELYISTMYLV